MKQLRALAIPIGAALLLFLSATPVVACGGHECYFRTTGEHEVKTDQQGDNQGPNHGFTTGTCNEEGHLHECEAEEQDADVLQTQIDNALELGDLESVVADMASRNPNAVTVSLTRGVVIVRECLGAPQQILLDGDALVASLQGLLSGEALWAESARTAQQE